MYKFNFLAKINQAKLEAKKKNRFITIVFSASLLSMIIIIGLMFLQSMGISSNYKEELEKKTKLEKKYDSFRKKDFFRYRKIQNIYNSQISRKKISSIFNIINNNIDSLIIIEDFFYEEGLVKMRFVARSTGSKSQLMTKINTIKNSMNESLVNKKFINNKEPIQLTQGPAIKETYDAFQYWTFRFELNLSIQKPNISNNNSGAMQN